MRHFSVILLCGWIVLLNSIGYSQSKFLKTYKMNSATASPLPPSNSISQIVGGDSVLWTGTSKGASKSLTGGRSWLNYRSDPAFANDGIFALAVRNDTTWAATGYEKEITDGTVQTGSGYAISTNAGSSWIHRNQTLDLTSDSILAYGINDSIWMLPVVVPEQNVTFDISLSPGTVWIASWASGLRKSTDNGLSWHRILLPADNQNAITPFDTLWEYRSNDTGHVHRIYHRFDPRRNNNMLAFSVHAIDSITIWCGTAGGINKSTDGGLSWKRFTHQNELSGIAGNWVIAIEHQLYHGITRVWATTWRANDPDEEFGVAFTDDGGISWTNILRGVKAYDFAFKDSIVYIASDDGIYRTEDGGLTFTRFSKMTDPSTRQIISSPQVYAVGVIRDTVFAGTGDGLASTIDNGAHQFGSTWTIYRTYQAVGQSDNSYAYPNPFAPNLGPVRIHYNVGKFDNGGGSDVQPLNPVTLISIEIFDFGMNRLRTLVHDASRASYSEADELWDGRDDNGRIVANGVYFYRITRGGSEGNSFGKILAIQ